MNKLVEHPDHYNAEGKKECWDEMIDIFGPEAVIIFDCLSAYKYRYRAGLKEGNPEEQDLDKIREYLKHASKLAYEPYISLESTAWKTLVKITSLASEGEDND